MLKKRQSWKTTKEKYEEYTEITKHLDDSDRMVQLKQAIWNHVLKKKDTKKRL